jgi:2-keto-3-deoxy-L-rhamnonate aldolase RhmA
MRINNTLQQLRRGETVFGCAIQSYRSPEVTRVFAAAGFDYVFIDMEHGAFDFETVHEMIVASNQAGITPVVRVGELLYSLVSRLLDTGAQGIVLPRVEDPNRLAEALTWMKYPPHGVRGYGILPQYVDYETQTMADVIEHMNSNVMMVVQFESVPALDRANELLSQPGVDVGMIGPADLSIALGVPGDFEHPLMLKAIDKFIEQAERYHVSPGIQTRNVQQAKFWTERGMRLVGAGADHGLLLAKAREAVKDLHNHPGGSS